MLRIITRTVDRQGAAHVGGPEHTSYRTFDIELPEIEKWLTRPLATYVDCDVIGVEVIPSPSEQQGDQS